ncbi:restriction endonuclease subunit S [bacterium]|nr:restriction endonuclease subunit S [bacterium]
MNKAWSIVPLNQVIRHRKEFIQISDFETYKRCRVQLHTKGIVLRDIVSGAEIKTKKQQVCRVGEFLVAEIDAKVGGFGIVPNDLDGAIVSSHYFLFQVDEAILNRKFLGFFIRTPAFREQVSAQGSTNYAAIRPSNVLEYTIPLPPFPEQQRIVARIEELTARIEEAKRLRRETLSQAELIMSSAISEVVARAEKEGWIKRQLREICQIVMGQSPPGHTYNERGEGLPFYQGKADFGKLYPVPRKWCSSPKKIARENDILISVRAPVGPTNLCREDSCIGRGLAALRTSNEIDFMLLLYFLHYKEIAISQLGQGSTFGAIGKERLGSIEIPVPPKNDQRRIVDYLDKLQSQVDELRKYQTETQKQIEALSQSILAKAFRGEL